MKRLFPALLSVAVAGLAVPGGPAHAHPHIFITAGATLIFDDEGRLGAVRVIWSYDSLFSLVVVEERGLDADFDGVLTPEETEQLSGFDMNWIEGYEGDSYLLNSDGSRIGLSEPLEWDAAYAEGTVVSTHLRALETRVPVGAAPVILQIYDPTYYTAYEVNLPVRVENAPEGCSAEVYVPDPAEATEELMAAMQEFAASDDAFLEEDFPAVGAMFAHEIRVTCAP